MAQTRGAPQASNIYNNSDGLQQVTQSTVAGAIADLDAAVTRIFSASTNLVPVSCDNIGTPQHIFYTYPEAGVLYLYSIYVGFTPTVGPTTFIGINPSTAPDILTPTGFGNASFGGGGGIPAVSATALLQWNTAATIDWTASCMAPSGSVAITWSLFTQATTPFIQPT